MPSSILKLKNLCYSWWLNQPILKNMLVKLDHFHRYPGENKKYLSCHHLDETHWDCNHLRPLLSEVSWCGTLLFQDIIWRGSWCGLGDSHHLVKLKNPWDLHFSGQVYRYLRLRRLNEYHVRYIIHRIKKTALKKPSVFSGGTWGHL